MENKTRILTEDDIDLAISVLKKYGIDTDDIYYDSKELGFTNPNQFVGDEGFCGVIIEESLDEDFDGEYLIHKVIELNGKFYTVFEGN